MFETTKASTSHGSNLSRISITCAMPSLLPLCFRLQSRYAAADRRSNHSGPDRVPIIAAHKLRCLALDDGLECPQPTRIYHRVFRSSSSLRPCRRREAESQGGGEPDDLTERAFAVDCSQRFLRLSGHGYPRRRSSFRPLAKGPRSGPYASRPTVGSAVRSAGGHQARRPER
jgi:hypothetical protein